MNGEELMKKVILMACAAWMIAAGAVNAQYVPPGVQVTGRYMVIVNGATREQYHFCFDAAGFLQFRKLFSLLFQEDIYGGVLQVMRYPSGQIYAQDYITWLSNASPNEWFLAFRLNFLSKCDNP